jgi:hypothetical protein
VRLGLLAVSVVAAGALLAGCTSSGQGSSAPPPSATAASPPSPTPSLTSPSPSPSATLTPSAPSTSISSSASVSPSKSASKSASVPANLRECGTTDLTLRVQKEGAVNNAELALLTLTNTSSTPCGLTGFPGVSLRADNAALGSPAVRTAKSYSTVALAHGAAASTTLSDVTTCQAALSDTVRVYPPDSTTFIDGPLVLRGCALHIDPLTAAA